MHHITSGELERRFNYHKPQTQAKADAHETVRETCKAAANNIIEATGGPSREQSLAITHLEEAMFWANAALAREVTGTDL